MSSAKSGELMGGIVHTVMENGVNTEGIKKRIGTMRKHKMRRRHFYITYVVFKTKLVETLLKNWNLSVELLSSS